MKHGPLIEGFPILKGLLCGSLLAGSLTVPQGIIVQIAIFIIAALIFIDSLFVVHREPHIMSFLITMLFGAVVGIFFALAELISLYMLIIFVAMAILYLYEFMSYRETHKR